MNKNKYIISLSIFIILSIMVFMACNDGYNGPGPRMTPCVEFPKTDTVENIKGIVKIEDTLVYISNYIDETKDLKYYPCEIDPIARKNGFPLQYSGFIRERSGDSKKYIELSSFTPISKETIITNYSGLIRNRDSASISAEERKITIQNFKVENHKIKLLLNYSGCTQGRVNYISLYKTTQVQGNIRVYGFITAPEETCITAYTLWYEIDAQFYKDHTFVIYDGVKTHEIYVPK